MAFVISKRSKSVLKRIGEPVSSTSDKLKGLLKKYPHYYIVITGSGSSKSLSYQFLTRVAK